MRDDMVATLEGRTFLSTRAVRDGAELTLAGRTRISLSFTGGRISAHAGCNSISGAATAWDGELVVEGLISTMMACLPDVDAQERWLIDLLKSRPYLDLVGNQLVLTSGESVLELLDRVEADPDRPLEGTHWRLQSIRTPDSVSSFADVAARVRFDGSQLSVDTGCNTGGGSVTVGDGTIGVGPLRLTRKAGPPDAMRVERHVIQVLQGTVPYTIDADVLTLGDSDNGLIYRAE